jgi:hypothetical protein
LLFDPDHQKPQKPHLDEYDELEGDGEANQRLVRDLFANHLDDKK